MSKNWGQAPAALGLAGVPMGAGMPIAYIGYQIMTNEGWAEVKSRQPGANTVSVQQQYVCHVRYGYPVLGPAGGGIWRGRAPLSTTGPEPTSSRIDATGDGPHEWRRDDKGGDGAWLRSVRQRGDPYGL